MLAATEALAAAQAELVAARAGAETAAAELVRASIADAQAQAELEAARSAEVQADAQLADVQARIDASRRELGALARDVYQQSAYSTLSVVLEAKTPADLVARLGYVEAVASGGNGQLERLEELRADVAAARAKQRAVRVAAEQARQAAADRLAETAVRDQEATAAQARVNAALLRRQDALQAAAQARAEDQARYNAYAQAAAAVTVRLRTMPALPTTAPGAAEAAAAGAASALADPTAFAPRGEGRFVRPGTGAQTSAFGPRRHPILGYVKVHTGVDIGRGDGVVYAAADGVVVAAESDGGYGNMTLIDHGTVGGQRLASLYAHQERFLVSPGTQVRAGQPIGVIGSTGFSTGPHLHFEVRLDGEPTDPIPWLAG